MNKTYSITINDNVYLVKLTDKKMKSVRMKYENNTIFISGYRINEKIANDFINKHLSWLNKKIEESNKINNYFNVSKINKFEIFYLFGQSYEITKYDSYYIIDNEKFNYRNQIDKDKEYKKLRNHYSYLLIEHANEIFNKFNIKPTLEVKDMKSKYGYCAFKENRIVLSKRLIHLPYYLIDYVIIHEICHLKVHNHQKAFYNEVNKYYKDYKKAIKDLKIYGILCK